MRLISATLLLNLPAMCATYSVESSRHTEADRWLGDRATNRGAKLLTSYCTVREELLRQAVVRRLFANGDIVAPQTSQAGYT